MDDNRDEPHGLQLWGGVECSVVRIGDQFRDQLELNGHAHRLEDLDTFAALGLRVLRYPVLWERVAPGGLAQADWSWVDERLGRLRHLGIRPIVGLVHHGSGPRYTCLTDPGFPAGLARFAQAVAERYPWIEDYTPINEPLTTARFSGQYGHWYPHGRDARTFATVLLTECRAVVQAMQAIRTVNPRARLVQTDDLGKVFSTPALAYQADFENERRWLTWDLLDGRVDRRHPIGRFLCSVGVAERDLAWFQEQACPPDIIGINHYLTSERFLDERRERYPSWCHGGNGRHAYADVEAVRVYPPGPAGPAVLLREAWERYRRPLAITEVHLGCTREEQLRWLVDVWDAALRQRANGVDVRAVTAWALLGTYDWDSLLTCTRGHYEPGAFDLTGGCPRPTALARALADLAQGQRPQHPVLDGPGWWRRPERLLYPPPADPAVNSPIPKRVLSRSKARPLLITGATGRIGRAFARVCVQRGLAHHLLRRGEMDIADGDSVNRALAMYRPWAVINAAGYVRVDDAEREPAVCFRENVQGPAVLADACADHALPLMTFSADLVFCGQHRQPYRESAPVGPLNVYGQSKVEAERRVLQRHPGALVIRTSACFSPWEPSNFVTLALQALAARRQFIAADDVVVSPTYVPDLVQVALDLLLDGERGLWHVANAGGVSWADLALQAAQTAGVCATTLEAVPTRALGLAAARPLYSVLESERGVRLPPLDSALSRYVHECDGAWNEGPLFLAAGVPGAGEPTWPAAVS